MFRKNVSNVRKFGSAALDMAFVASEDLMDTGKEN